jgi:hypothetical protein
MNNIIRTDDKIALTKDCISGVNAEFIGLAPNGEPMYKYSDNEGEWEEYWQPVPGGGSVQTRPM